MEEILLAGEEKWRKDQEPERKRMEERLRGSMGERPYSMLEGKKIEFGRTYYYSEGYLFIG